MGDIHITYPGHLFIYPDGIDLCKSVFGTKDLLNFCSGLSLTYGYPACFGLDLNLSKCAECLLTTSQPTYPADPYFMYTEGHTRVDFVKYLGTTINKNLRWSSHI